VKQVNLVARTSGVITSFPVQVGQTVQQGDVVALLDDSTQQAQLQQAQASLVAAQANQLKVSQGATAGQIEIAKAGINGATTAVGNAQKNLDAAQQSANADTTAAQQAVANAQAAL